MSLEIECKMSHMVADLSRRKWLNGIQRVAELFIPYGSPIRLVRNLQLASNALLILVRFYKTCPDLRFSWADPVGARNPDPPSETKEK